MRERRGNQETFGKEGEERRRERKRGEEERGHVFTVIFSLEEE